MVFNCSFTHRETPIRVRVYMMTMPDSMRQKIVVMLVTRVNQPVQVTEALQVPFSASAPAEAAASRVANAILSAANNQPGQPAPARPLFGSAANKQ